MAKLITNIDSPSSMPSLESVWESGAAFLAHCVEGNGPASFVHPLADAESAPELGELVSVLIRFIDSDMSFRVHARVVAIDATSPDRFLKLRFLEDERPRQDMVLACAEGESFPFVRRRHQRLPCYWPARVSVGQTPLCDAVATDISEGGARLVTTSPIDKGRKIALWLSVPNQPEGVTTHGRVVYVQQHGAQPGVGVEFEFESPHEREDVIQHVRRLQQATASRA